MGKSLGRSPTWLSQTLAGLLVPDAGRPLGTQTSGPSGIQEELLLEKCAGDGVESTAYVCV